jgi:hypothetical protein
MNDAMDVLQDNLLVYDKYIDIPVLIKVYRNTKSSSVLRKFGSILFIYKKWKNNEVRNENDNSHTESEPDVIADTANNATENTPKREIDRESLFFTWDEIEELCTKFEDKDELGEDRLSKMFHYCRRWNGSDLEDPRIRDEEDNENRCLWHCHEKESSCRQVGAGSLPGWVSDTAADYFELQLVSAEVAMARLFPVEE